MSDKFKPNVKTIYVDVHVIVHPYTRPLRISSGIDHFVETCEDIEKEIKRHVDNVESTETIITRHAECMHCGLGYEEDIITGEPVCCAQAQDDWKKWTENNT